MLEHRRRWVVEDVDAAFQFCRIYVNRCFVCLTSKIVRSVAGNGEIKPDAN